LEATLDDAETMSSQPAIHSHSYSSAVPETDLKGTDHSATPPPLDGSAGLSFQALTRRLSSFRGALLSTHRASLELLVPCADSSLRKTSRMAATVNLVATIAGGGVLSLPLAFRRTGILVGSLMVVLAAVMSNFSLYILCSCARRTGVSTYGEVARRVFGRKTECGVTIVLFTLLAFFLVAYMVLVRDIWSTVYTFATGRTLSVGPAGGETVLLVGVVAMVSPFMLQRSLHPLRYNCYISFASISVLCVSIIYRAFQRGAMTEDFWDKVLWYTTDYRDVLFALPLFVLSFLATYNMLSVHCALVHPTRRRVREVIGGSIGSCCILFYAFGIGGYCYALDHTLDNILLNFDPHDKVIILGKISFGISLTLAMPLVVLPARECFLMIPVQVQAWINETRECQTTLLHSQERARLLSSTRARHPSSSSMGTAVSVTSFDSEGAFDHDASSLSLGKVIAKPVIETVDPDTLEQIIHMGSTLLVVATCLVAAVAAPRVAVVWSICGSSLAFVIGFIFPAAAYIRLRGKRKGMNPRIVGAWCMLVFSILSAIICTFLTIYNLFYT